MTNAYVQTRSLTKRYGRLTALDDCGLEIRRGEVFGLLGPNGSGKTTLLRLLMGFLRPSAGEASAPRTGNGARRSSSTARTPSATKSDCRSLALRRFKSLARVNNRTSATP